MKSKCVVKAELGEVIASTKYGRETNDSVTIFKSLGLAVQDLVSAKLITDISKSSTSSNPIKILNSSIRNVDDDIKDWGGKEVETVCKGDHASFSSMATHYPELGLMTCEVYVDKIIDGSECTKLCIVYASHNGNMLGMINDWDRFESRQHKMKILFKFKCDDPK